MLLGIIITSCATSNSIINTYLKDEINQNEKESKTFIVKEKVNPQKTFQILMGLKYITENRYSGSKEFTIEEFDEMYKKYENDTLLKTWDIKRFDNKKIVLVSYLDENDLFEKYIKLGLSSKLAYCYMLSEPIFLKNKKYFCFYVSKTSTNMTKGNPYYSKVLLFKKVNGKYKLIEEINEEILY